LDGAWPRPGSVALATQSGAFGSYAFGLAQGRNLGFSHFIATGNESDVDVSECIAWFARDADTKVILATFESVKNGARLIEALRLARLAKVPVIAMKVGTSEVGAAAAASHTGSLAGADAIYDAVLREEGAWRAHSIEEMVDIAYACSQGAMPRGDRLGIVTTSGGIGVLLADAAAAHGLRLPETPATIQDEIRALLPFASPINPIDTSAQLMGDLSLFARILDLGLKAGQWDAVLGFLAHVGRNPAHWAQLKSALFQVRADHPNLPFVLTMLSSDDLRAELEKEGFLVFEEPVRAIRAIAATSRIAANLSSPVKRQQNQVTTAPLARLDSSINEQKAKRILSAAGVQCTEDRLARTADEAAEVASSIGFPVVMKVVSPQIAHKSDVGGVVLNVTSADAARQAYHAIITGVAHAAPAATIEGALISPMVQGGIETILGVQRDPVFGPVVMFGLGGIFVETFKDVSFRTAPFDKHTALAMIEEIKGLPLLKGARGRPAADLDALAVTLSRLSEFADVHRSTIQSIDINPYIVLPRGGTAVDALVIVD
jgi:acyl-CoA synthetase (NDP forming)